jgi:hypothetical protein
MSPLQMLGLYLNWLAEAWCERQNRRAQGEKV